MAILTLDEVLKLLRDCAGPASTVSDQVDVLDVPFARIGYDSLAVLQATGLIEFDYGIRLEDEAVTEAETPRQYLELVNGALRQSAA